MIFIQQPDSTNAVHCLLVTNMAANGIDRVGGVGNNAAFADDLGSFSDLSLLGIFRMNAEVVAHENIWL